MPRDERRASDGADHCTVILPFPPTAEHLAAWAYARVAKALHESHGDRLRLEALSCPGNAEILGDVSSLIFVLRDGSRRRRCFDQASSPDTRCKAVVASNTPQKPCHLIVRHG